MGDGEGHNYYFQSVINVIFYVNVKLLNYASRPITPYHHPCDILHGNTAEGAAGRLEGEVGWNPVPISFLLLVLVSDKGREKTKQSRVGNEGLFLPGKAFLVGWAASRSL